MSRILNREQNAKKYAHEETSRSAQGGEKTAKDDPAWQKQIRDAKQAVADAAARQLRFDDDDDRP